MQAQQKQRILLVEDNLTTSRLVHEILHKLDSDIISTRSLEASYNTCARSAFDVAIVDRKLLDGDGLELVAYLQDTAFSTRVLVVSHMGQATDRVRALESGADDCLSKPFNPGELLLRTKKLLNLRKQAPQHNYFLGSYTFKQDEGVFSTAHFTVQLQRREAQLLSLLWQQYPATVTRESIIEKIWGDTASFAARNTVEVYIRRLRSRLGDQGSFIQTVRGYGYRLMPSL